MLVLGVGGMLFAMRSEARKHPIYAADVKPFHSLRIADRNGVLLQEVRSRDGRSAPVRRTGGSGPTAVWTGLLLGGRAR